MIIVSWETKRLGDSTKMHLTERGCGRQMELAQNSVQWCALTSVVFSLQALLAGRKSVKN
jgi:hypothetical protein